jgi:sialidase-1
MASALLTPGIPAALVLMLLGPASRAAEPRLVKTDLFAAGEGGYKLYRIPGLVVTARGTVLAYCEARKQTGLDWDDIEILLRRSADGGASWSQPRALPHPAGRLDRNPAALANAELARRAALPRSGQIAFHNPVAIADRGGAVHFLYCVDYYRCFYLRSDDDGATFTRPVEITPALTRSREDYDCKVFATGPAHGIQLRSGRLVVPVWLSTGARGNAHRPSVVATVYSDDGGGTWLRGDIVAGETDPLTDPSEAALAELTDGRVLLNIRSESRANRRAVAFSPDGATGWTRPVFDDQLKEPICMASLCRLSERGKQDRDRLLFANPDNLGRGGREGAPGAMRDRRNLTLKLSYDEGKSWPVARVLEQGTSGYSDLAVGRDGTIYCLYERGSVDGRDHFATQALTLARFNLAWLSDGKDSLGPARR